MKETELWGSAEWNMQKDGGQAKEKKKQKTQREERAPREWREIQAGEDGGKDRWGQDLL